MNTSTISTAELRQLERQYRNPQNLLESLALRGVRAELADPDRRSGFNDPNTDVLREEALEAEDRIYKLEVENSQLEDKLSEAKEELDKKG